MNAIRTILLVDDDTEIREEIAKVVKSWDYAVDEAADYQETMGQVSGHNYDLVLLDLRIPDRNSHKLGAKGGFEALEDIGHMKPSLPVVVFSDDTQVENIVHSIRTGAYDFLPKEELLARTGRCRNIVKDAARCMGTRVSPLWSVSRVRRRINSLRKQIDILDNRMYGVDVDLARGGLSTTQRLKLEDEKRELKQRLEELEREEQELQEELQ